MVSLSSSSVPHYYRYRHRSVRVSVYHGVFRKCLSYDVVYETYGWKTWAYRKLDRADKSQRRSKSYCQYPGLWILPITEVEKVENIIFTFTHIFASEPRDGILGHQFNLTKYSSLLLHAIHSPFSWRVFFIKKSILFSGFKNPLKKISK